MQIGSNLNLLHTCYKHGMSKEMAEKVRTVCYLVFHAISTRLGLKTTAGHETLG